MSNQTYVLISDIHANLPALEAVLADVSKGTPAGIFHLGDLVGYAPWPNETVALLQKAGITGVAGNYDSTVATDYKHCGCRADNPREEELSHVSYEWTRRAVTAETKAFLGGLPFRIDIKPYGGHVAGPTIMLFHATPVNNLVYVTADRTDGFLSKMAQQAGAKSGDVICFGHTHKPWHRVVEGIHFVNTGSVGRPKDGDPRACYVIVDMSGAAPVVGFVRVEYDIDRAARGIEESGLPIEFAEFLRNGG
ncbi:MAG TPA: metallophosphoesterase family protein, partial [Gemmatimonadaceae bacterium]|nr:metallophosphoesterase family protein [Gemmatimonadaceae bacterium]